MTRHCEVCLKGLECPSYLDSYPNRRVVCTDCAVAAYKEIGDIEKQGRAERDATGWWDFDETNLGIVEGLNKLRVKRGHCPQCGKKH